jgi:hypothetical protein
MKDSEYYADRLYSLAISSPEVNALDKHAIARYIRQEAENICLDWRAVLQECGDLHPYVLDFKKAGELDEDYSVTLK